MSQSKGGEQENKAGCTHAVVAVWRTADEVRHPERRGRERDHQGPLQGGSMFTRPPGERAEGAKRSALHIPASPGCCLASSPFCSFHRHFSEALTLWGSPDVWDITRPRFTLEEMPQRKRPLTGHVHHHVPCAWRGGTDHLVPHVWLLLNFVYTEFSFVCSLRAGWPTVTNPTGALR